MTRYLVTGGAGFIGSQIAERLLKEGHAVAVLDNLSTGKSENIEFLKSLKGDFTFVQGDVVDPSDCARAMKGVEIVFHEAALGSVPKSIEDPFATHRSNVEGTLRVLMAARAAGVRRVVNAASSSAYGDTPVLPKVETMPGNPFSPYAATKLTQELYCRSFAVSYGLETVSLRYFNVFGSRQDPHSQYAAVIPRFFQALLRKQQPEIYGDGEQTRDFGYVGDVVEANLLASKFEGAEGQVFNIAGGKAITINELARKIAALLGSDIVPKYHPARVGDIRHSLADVSAARKNLGFSPKTSLDEGLRAASDWYRKYLA